MPDSNNPTISSYLYALQFLGGIRLEDKDTICSRQRSFFAQISFFGIQIILSMVHPYTGALWLFQITYDYGSKEFMPSESGCPSGDSGIGSIKGRSHEVLSIGIFNLDP
jgi:hypothetical protein